jgi:hypothetical protein
LADAKTALAGRLSEISVLVAVEVEVDPEPEPEASAASTDASTPTGEVSLQAASRVTAATAASVRTEWMRMDTSMLLMNGLAEP